MAEAPLIQAHNKNANLFWRIGFAAVGVIAVCMLVVAVLHLNRHWVCVDAPQLCLYDFPQNPN